MMSNLLSYNLKKQKLKHTLVIMLIGIIIPIVVINLSRNLANDGMLKDDLFLMIYGGIEIDVPIQFTMLEIIIFLLPHLLIIYFSEIYYLDLIDQTPSNSFLRIGNMYKWNRAINTSLFYVILKYYFILYISSSIVIINNNIDYIIILKLLVLSILNTFCIVSICNNLYYIYNRNSNSIVIFILINILSIFMGKFGEKLNLFIIINHVMIKRHCEFIRGYKSLTFSFSIIYLTMLIGVNLILSAKLVKKQDF